MEWTERMNQVIGYIEEHITEEIDYQDIVTEWLPAAGYEFAEGPDVEVYFEPNPADTQYEVWIPVRKA